MAVLTVAHNIFLTKEEAYAIYSRKEINVIGISIPVWVSKGKTSEPAVEVFCEYKITNYENEPAIVKIRGNGYEINLPGNIIPDTVNNAKKLIDIKDGGCESMDFRIHDKVRRFKKFYEVAHIVEFRRINELIDSLIKL